jgi:ketosteroid isomerase-like protein
MGGDGNVELVRRATEAMDRGDVEATLEEWADDAVLDWSRSHGLDARIFRGKDEVRRFLIRFREVFSGIDTELLDPVEVAEGVVVVENLAHVRGRDGIAAQARSAWMITIEDGVQTSLTLYQTRRDALKAAEALGRGTR